MKHVIPPRFTGAGFLFMQSFNHSHLLNYSLIKAPGCTGCRSPGFILMVYPRFVACEAGFFIFAVLYPCHTLELLNFLIMHGKKHSQTINRRNFVGNTVKLVTIGSLLMPIVEACGNKKSSHTGTTGPDTTKGKASKNISKKHPRKKWSHESLVMNSKTHVIHFPTAVLYTYYDEIKPNHLQEIDFNKVPFEPMKDSPRLNKEQSGNILEILTLKELKKDINDSTLIIAIDTLSMAFKEEYEKANSKNFRLHEMMLQLVALNNAIPADQKWMTFNAKVKKPEQLRKRQDWMSTETKFTDRINYITQRRNDYISRLNKRAAKYSFT